MIIKLTLNLSTLQAVLEDSTAIINEIKRLDTGDLFIEVSVPDPEFTTPMGQ